MGLTQTRIPYLRMAGARMLNVITGCSNTPAQCAVRARGLCWAERESDDGFTPTFHPEALDALERLRKPALIAVGFRGDICTDGIGDVDRALIWRRMFAHPEHTFVLLTKRPFFLPRLPDNMWAGTSVCVDRDFPKAISVRRRAENAWASFEPVLGSFPLESLREILSGCQVKFAVIGGLSDGNRVLRPEEGGTQAEWVAPIIEAAAEAGCKIFLKNLRKEVITQITNPRTGERFGSMFELREIPEGWNWKGAHS